MMKNVFYFILSIYFSSQNIYVFVMTFWSWGNDLIGKIRLTSEFMTSQSG